MAENKNTPIYILEKLAFKLPDNVVKNLSNTFYELQRIIASNENTSTHILKKLTTVKESSTRKAAIQALKAKPLTILNE